jgi:peptidoglycan/xylan/chitin deacetylase (PgdA/CDA1 family)
MRITTSWDDGHPLDLKLAELLDRHGMPGTFYVPLRNREGLPVMDAAALRQLDARFEIGSHTADHHYADRGDSGTWARQVIGGKQELEQALGHAVTGFCYPGGRSSAGARQVVRDAGFAYARTIVNLHLDAGIDRYQLPTTAQFFPHPRRVLLSNWLRGGRLSARLGGACLALGPGDWQRRLLRLLHEAHARDGVFHLWGHSWEIEQFGLWGPLDTLLREAARLAPPDQRLCNGALVAESFGPAV